MKKEEIKKKNLKNFFTGFFFVAMSGALLSFFLPFYLKERGLSILEIGVLFTIGLAVGSLFFSVIFSKILKRISLRQGLNLSALLSFLQTFLFFIIPTPVGSLAYKFTNRAYKSVSSISNDVTSQHNVVKNEHRKVGAYFFVLDSFALSIGILLSILLVVLVGFKLSFLIFACLALPSFFFFSKMDDKTRFKLKKKIKLSKISFKLKLVLFSEIIYWLALASSFALVITFLVIDRFSGSMFWIAFLFLGLYGSIALTTLFTHKFLDKFNLIKTSVVGMIILFLSSVLIIISQNIFLVLGAFILEGIGAGIWGPSKTAVHWKLVKKESREKVSGYLMGWRAFVNTLGPLVGGFLVFKLGILAPFYFKATMALFIIFVYVYILRKN